MLLKHLDHHWNKVKSFVGHAHHHISKWAGEMDAVARVGRKAFSLAAPMLEDAGQRDFVRQGVQALGHYDNARKAVVDADGYARGHARRINDADLFA
jgi:hypothetical protein